MAHPLAKVKNFSYDVLNQELELDFKANKTTAPYLKAYMDDFWQDGSVTLLPGTRGPLSGDLDAVLHKRYVFRNIIKEVAERAAGAFFGKAPTWRYRVDNAVVEADQRTEDQKQLDDALSEFWIKQNVAEVLKKAFEARLVYGRGGIRLYVPAKFKRQNLARPNETGPSISDQEESEEYVQFPDMVSAIRAMRVEYVPPEQGKLLQDGGEFFSIVRYAYRKDWETKKDVNMIEFSFVDDSDMTFIGLVEENEVFTTIQDENLTLSTPFDLAGWCTYREFRGKPYVTKALFQLNQLVNLALTCAGFSLVDNGFGEMILTNVQLETTTVEGPDGPIQVPKRIKRGGGAVQNFIGVENYDDNTGASSRATPTVTFREPSPLQAYKDGFDLAYAACLQEVQQLYALISGDATASGESRIQALTDFILKIKPFKSEVDEEGSGLLTTVIRWAAALSSTNAANVNVVYDSRMHVAQLSDAEKTLVMSMREKGTISRETERVLLGIEDPDLEAELIQKEQQEGPDTAPVATFGEKLDQVLKLIGVPGMDQETPLKYLGFTDEQIQSMVDNTAQAEADLQARIAELSNNNPPDPNNPDANNPGNIGQGAAGGQ